jgi:hypothetical protein
MRRTGAVRQTNPGSGHTWSLWGSRPFVRRPSWWVIAHRGWCIVSAMRYLLAVFLALTTTTYASAQYPKTITLTVTRITRVDKATPACNNCATEITVEAHTATVNFVLSCTENMYPQSPENRTMCAHFETGQYQVVMPSPEIVNFWKEPPPKGTTAPVFTVRMEEARGKD